MPSFFLFVSQERKLSAFPCIEVCTSDLIEYMAPLSRQTDFFVPEMKEEVKTDVKEEDSDEDRGTDITGKNCGHQPGRSDCFCVPCTLARVHISEHVSLTDVSSQVKVKTLTAALKTGVLYFRGHGG